MTPASPSLIKVVHEDVTYLAAHWPKGEVRDDEIRRSSTVLRRLLTYRDLIQVWVTVVGQKDYLVTGDYIEIRDTTRLNEVDYATASPANQGGGMRVFAALVFNKIQNGPEPIAITRQEVSLKRYLNQTACVISGVPLGRDELVQFVANKLGGAHFDDGRQKPREQSIAAMEQYSVGNRPALIHEMLSIAQALASSQSTIELLGALDDRQLKANRTGEKAGDEVLYHPEILELPRVRAIDVLRIKHAALFERRPIRIHAHDPAQIRFADL